MNELDLFGGDEASTTPSVEPVKPADAPATAKTGKKAVSAKKAVANVPATTGSVVEAKSVAEPEPLVEVEPLLSASVAGDVTPPSSPLPEAERGSLQSDSLDEGEHLAEDATKLSPPLRFGEGAGGRGNGGKSGSIALVTGSSRGIGRGIAIELAKLGHTVVINYAGNAQAAGECLQMVRDAGGDGITVQGDVSIEADRARMVQNVLDTYGRIDLLVNNAGVAPNVRADILEAGAESFDRLININLKGPYFLTQTIARQMIKQVEASPDAPRPQIVTISSVSVYTASTNRGDYCISKAGLGMMTALWAARLAEWGINVYEIRPGVIATDMTGGVKEKYDKMIENGVWPIKRWGEPSDVGRAVSAIARGDFPFSTGEVFNVDGGFHLRTL